MIKKRKAVVCSIGLGYVGMHLASAFVIENKYSNDFKYWSAHIYIMPDITLSIPEELYKKMKEHRGIGWTEVIRNAVMDYIHRLEEGKLEVTTEELLEVLGSEFEKDLSEISFEEAEGLYEKMRDKEWKRLYTTQAV